jgi:predicted RND superfamily exporter protein
LCFFGATFGVGVYSKIEMIGSLCTLMSRGAIVSMLTVICVLPTFLIIFDKLICKTTIGIKNKI